MPQYYINAESVTQDGLTPSTGYHNFGALIAARGAMASDWIVDVVQTTTNVAETNPQTLCGTIKAYNNGWPIIDIGTTIIYTLATFTHVSHIQLYKQNFTSLDNCFNIGYSTTNIWFEYCKIKILTETYEILNPIWNRL